MQKSRPTIICHMMESVDGRIDCDMVDKISGEEYYDALNSLECQAHIEGRHSYQMHHCGFDDFQPVRPNMFAEESFYKAADQDLYTVSVDSCGILMWENEVPENHICILSTRASHEYLEYLRSKGISYIVAGSKTVNLAEAMKILKKEFGVKRAALVGGGVINGGFLKDGLIDELSVMIAPGIDGRKNQPALFDGVRHAKGFMPSVLKLKNVKTCGAGVVWIRYSVPKTI